MASEIINGFGYRNGVYFRDRALQMGLGTEPVLAPGNDLWHVTQEGRPISPELTSEEAHGFLDELAAGDEPEEEDQE